MKVKLLTWCLVIALAFGFCVPRQPVLLPRECPAGVICPLSE